MPDEDVVYELLVDGKTKLDNTLRKEWKNFYGDDWTSSSDSLHGSDDFSLLSYEMKSFVDYLVEKQPQLAKQVISKSGTAAHLGPVDVELAEA